MYPIATYGAYYLMRFDQLGTSPKNGYTVEDVEFSLVVWRGIAPIRGRFATKFGLNRALADLDLGLVMLPLPE